MSRIHPKTGGRAKFAVRIIDGTLAQRWIYDDFELFDGEILFDNEPSEAELEAAFPDYIVVRRKTARAALAGQRRTIMNGGVRLDGIALKTDAASRLALIQLATLGDPQPHFKEADGSFSALSADAIETRSKAVNAFIAACFAREAALAQEIDTAVDPLKVDIMQGWP